MNNNSEKILAALRALKGDIERYISYTNWDINDSWYLKHYVNGDEKIFKDESKKFIRKLESISDEFGSRIKSIEDEETNEKSENKSSSITSNESNEDYKLYYVFFEDETYKIFTNKEEIEQQISSELKHKIKTIIYAKPLQFKNSPTKNKNSVIKFDSELIEDDENPFYIIYPNINYCGQILSIPKYEKQLIQKQVSECVNVYHDDVKVIQGKHIDFRVVEDCRTTLKMHNI